MMKRSAFLFLCIAVSLVAASQAYAYRIVHTTRLCAFGGTFDMYQEIDDNGNMVDIWGTLCDGTPFLANPGNVQRGPTNPLGDVSDMYTETADGFGWTRMNLDAAGHVLQAWGKTRDGQYYQIMDWIPGGGGVQ